jgi:hypothetical protein
MPYNLRSTAYRRRQDDLDNFIKHGIRIPNNEDWDPYGLRTTRQAINCNYFWPRNLTRVAQYYELLFMYDWSDFHIYDDLTVSPEMLAYFENN